MPPFFNFKVTGIKTIANETRQVNYELERLFNTLNEGYYSLDIQSGKVLHVSASMEKICGYPVQRFYDDPNFWYEIIYPGDKIIVDETREELMKGKLLQLEYRIIHANGSVRWVESKVCPTLGHDGSLIQVEGIVTDITNRKFAEEKLVANEQRYRLVIENPILGIAWVSKEGTLLHTNETLCKMLGYTMVEMLDQPMANYTHPNDLEVDNFLTNQILEGKLDTYRLEKRYITKSKEVLWCELNFSAVKNANGLIHYFIGIVQDISARRMAEDEIVRLNETLEKKVHERTAELEAAIQDLESFSYSLSHDLRTPLRNISDYEKILTSISHNLDNLGKELLKKISESAHQMTLLIEDLMQFSRYGQISLAKSEVNMNELVQVVLAELKISDKPHVKIDVKHLNPAYCDPILVRQVWVNLISNAVKYSSKNEHPHIEIGMEKDAYFVKDNGVGFDMKYVGKLFEVFQRLHKVSDFEGTGVGLAIVQRIVNKHGGKIWPQAEVGKGAVFYFNLPPA